MIWGIVIFLTCVTSLVPRYYLQMIWRNTSMLYFTNSMSVQKYFKCCYYFICLFSLKVSLVKANVDVPAVIITFLSVKLSTLSNAIMSITNKWVTTWTLKIKHMERVVDCLPLMTYVLKLSLEAWTLKSFNFKNQWVGNSNFFFKA